MPENTTFEERRAFSRAIRTFKPSCIEIDGSPGVALLRDLSPSGAGFESDQNVLVGQTLRYRWGDHDFRDGRVIWTNGSFFGVANDEVAQEPITGCGIERSVRIPLCAPATIFLDGSRIEAEVLNFSQRGLCALAAHPVRDGALVTVKVGRRYFESATSKWSRSSRMGVSFVKPMALPEMSALMAGR